MHFFKSDYFKTVETKVIMIARYGKLSMTMTINTSQRTSDHSAEVTNIGFPLKYIKIRFSLILPIELKFDLKTP